ncbi:hypothetical protein [Pseudoxanthomonas mexicana]
MELMVPRNRDLTDLLTRASSSDLNVLADLITDFGKGRVALDNLIKRHILMHKEIGDLQDISDVLAREICAFGGNTFANAWRQGGVAYKELAMDVANKLGAKTREEMDVFAIEGAAISKALEDASGGNSITVPRTGVDLASTLGPIISALVTNGGSITGVLAAGGASGVATAIGGRAATLAAPPLAIAAAGATVLQAASPAYRITVPAVLQIAKIRRLQFDTDLATYREALHACK